MNSKKDFFSFKNIELMFGRSEDKLEAFEKKRLQKYFVYLEHVMIILRTKKPLEKTMMQHR